MDLSKYRMIKRVPERPAARKNDLFISNKTNFASSLRRVVALFRDSESKEVRIHASGMAIAKAVTLALRAQAHSSVPDTQLLIETSSVEMVDDFEPLEDELPPLTQRRTISSIHITVQRKFPIV